MLSAYVFALAVSGSLLLIATFSDFLDADVGDVEVDTDVDLDGADVDAFKLFSVRGLLYFLLGFGLVGTALTLLWDGGRPVLTGVAAAGSGLLSGAIVTTLFGWLKRSESGDRLDEASFVGLPGRMSLPIGEGGLGKVRIERGDRVHELLAQPFEKDSGDPSGWTRVVVVDVKDGRALVVPGTEGLLPDPE